MKIIVRGKTIRLSPHLLKSDVPALVEWLQDKTISQGWSIDEYGRIPYPYKRSHALRWVQDFQHHVATYGQFACAVIRDENKKLIGEVGFTFDTPPHTKNTAEIAYWLAAPFWGSGISTAAVGAMCDIGFKQFDLNKIIAHVNTDNIGSSQVLVKNGFLQEGYLREHFYRDNDYYDVKLYGLTRKNWHEKT